MTVTPSDFTVNWASTVPNPGSDLTGQFSVKFANAAPVVVLPVKPNGTNFSGSLDVVGLQKVFQAAKAASTTPTLIVSMDRAKEHLERSITVTFAVPKTADSAQQMAKKVVDSGSSAAGISQSLKAISDGVSQPTNKKFTWQDLLQAGLGILLKAI